MKFSPAMTTEAALVPEGGGIVRLRQLHLVYQPSQALQGTGQKYLLDRHEIYLGRAPEGAQDITLADNRASRQHAQVFYDSSRHVFLLKDLNSRNGTFLNGRRLEEEKLSHGDVLRIGDSLLVYVDLELSDALDLGPYEAKVAVARAGVEAEAALAAPAALPMLLLGATGVGKELLARSIHQASGRSGPFVAVNCATLGHDLIAAELFGHVAGAFAVAEQSRDGLFVSAQGGTLFLDEVAELPISLQPALLRVLQEAKVRPLGADSETEIDVRILSATHQDLRRAVQLGRFRQDLYARLSGVALELPPLMERKEELLGLFTKFLDSSLPLSVEAAELLLNYPWPENVRELKNIAERVRLFLPRLEKIDLRAFPEQLRNYKPNSLRAKSGLNKPSSQDESPPRDELEALLKTYQGNVAQVARALGKHRQQVYRWLRKNHLEASAYRGENS